MNMKICSRSEQHEDKQKIHLIKQLRLKERMVVDEINSNIRQ